MVHLPEGTSMIATEVASPFLTPFKLCLVLAIFVSMPFSLYQLWSFVAPGLYKHEKRMIVPLVVSSTILFYAGMIFAYYVVFPLIFGFLTSAAPEGITVATDIGKYLDFVLTLFFAFGLAFEVPIATIILVSMGITTPDSLVEKRPYIVVGAFVVGMFLTPPDVVSQTLLALPMLILFEMGVFFSRLMGKQDAVEDECDASPDVADEDESELEDDELEEDMLSLEGEEAFDKTRYSEMSEEELDEEYGNTEDESDKDNQR
jgi:sec-independent protein translocase protein TatC